MRYAAALFGACLLIVSAAAYAATPTFPPLTGRVVDAAGILSEPAERELTRLLEAHERATRIQLVVATIADLGDEDVESYGYQLAREWGIGQKGKDDGVVLLVAPAARAVRIEVGYGLEGVLTDAVSSVIVRNRIVPAFRTGDYEGGIRAGVAGIIEALGGDAPEAEPTRVVHKIPVGIFWLLLILFVFGGMGGGRRGRRLARAVAWGVVVGGMRGHRGGGLGGGGFGGGGGFRGGGGGFGGGGATGRW